MPAYMPCSGGKDCVEPFDDPRILQAQIINILFDLIPAATRAALLLRWQDEPEGPEDFQSSMYVKRAAEPKRFRVSRNLSPIEGQYSSLSGFDRRSTDGRWDLGSSDEDSDRFLIVRSGDEPRMIAIAGIADARILKGWCGKLGFCGQSKGQQRKGIC